VGLVIEGNKPKRLYTARPRFQFCPQNFGRAVNRTLACLERDFHKFALRQRIRQDQ